ncbi:peptide chain release factor 2 [Candidatus Similichlamydia laticola]|uniref:Peptide chain release factor 2 n=1 Tax=Candidatus Similichlamydia laticola TaxID=2170265 RepID=A0A369KCU3_9BACT|nr:peptide chain release factor 2 [Candidatus Similichlamydia laticola]RDB31280.1 Peptide chain release factor 2 [Candidatus Similichlamydia laticola]
MGGVFDLPNKRVRVEEIERKMEDPAFWEDQEVAQDRTKELSHLKWWLRQFGSVESSFLDLKELAPLLEEGEDSFAVELLKGLRELLPDLRELEIQHMLSGAMDQSSCFMTINAGAGGTESCDWVDMLARMYSRWASKKGWQVEVLDRLEGEVAGSKSTTFRFHGEYAFGYAKSERGVHRLVRLSPFDANQRRHTSFASVDVTPEVSDTVCIEGEMRSEDLRIDTYRASGAGGQHVNRRDSAVRIVHLPTGLVVSCQSERSQVQNRETCFKMLRSKLYQLRMTEREQELEKLSPEKKDIGWGSQIRSYVLQPYSAIKDKRTQLEVWGVENVQEVLDGDLDPFIEEYLKQFGGAV